jgi:oligo-alginate lyase
MLWFAREKSCSDIARDEINSIKIAKSILLNDTTSSAHKDLSRHFAFEVLWWNPELSVLSKSNIRPLHCTAGGHMPLAVMRSSWNDSLATYVAIKGGTPNNSHGHMDAGSFIFEANGVRWALDLGAESYDKMRAAKLDLWNYSQNSNRWETFRTGPESHNILRFNNERQEISGLAEILELPDENGSMGNMVDLSSTYKTQVEKVSRTIKLYPDRSITIQDEWTTGKESVIASFQWLTEANASICTFGVLLEQNGKSLKMIMEAPYSKYKPKILIEDVSKSKAKQDSDNPGVSRIVIKLKTDSKSSSFLKVTAIPCSSRKDK